MLLKRIVQGTVLVALLSQATATPASTSAGPSRDAGTVRLWNQIAADAIVVTGANAPASSGVLMAIVQLAVYNASVALVGGYEPYGAGVWAPHGASVDAAVAQSAHDVLVDLLPAQSSALGAQLAATLATIPDGQAKAKGVLVGRHAARAILTDRIGDGRFDNVPYSFGVPGPGVYQPTPPAFSTSPLVPWVAHVRPFTMTSPDQFRPGPPPPLDSRRWARAYQRTQSYGDVNSSVRTPEQSAIAIFWTEHAIRHWNRNIRSEAARVALDAMATARLLAITNTAIADSLIGCWDAKYHYSLWRPVTAIQQGDTDGRTDTISDPSWLPFQTTPNHPEYPGAHACVSTAVAHVLRRFFHSDETTFAMDAIVGGVTYVHTFTRYTAAGAEARDARIYGGMHYEFSNEAGARLGRQVARQMFDRGFFKRARNGQ